MPEEKQKLVEEKDADNIAKVLCKSFIQWFWELNLCSCKYRVGCFDSLRLFFSCCWSESLEISGLSGNQLVLFSLESWCFPLLLLGKHQDSRLSHCNCFPRDLTLSVQKYLLIWLFAKHHTLSSWFTLFSNRSRSRKIRLLSISKLFCLLLP